MQDGIYDEFLSAMTDAVKETKTGYDPADEDILYGPINNANQLGHVSGIVDRAPEHARVLAGGRQQGAVGFFYEPTLIADLHQDDELVQTEVFGPVLTAQRFADEEKALAFANGSEYALASSVWTSNVGTAARMAARLDFGCVWINTHIPLVGEMPHGGFKHSGLRQGPVDVRVRGLHPDQARDAVPRVRGLTSPASRVPAFAALDHADRARRLGRGPSPPVPDRPDGARWRRTPGSCRPDGRGPEPSATRTSSPRRCGCRGRRGPSGRGCPGRPGGRRSGPGTNQNWLRYQPPGRNGSESERREGAPDVGVDVRACCSQPSARLSASDPAVVEQQQAEAGHVAAGGTMPPSCIAEPSRSQVISASNSAPIGCPDQGGDQVGHADARGTLAHPAEHVGVGRAVDERAAVRPLGRRVVR